MENGPDSKAIILIFGSDRSSFVRSVWSSYLTFIDQSQIFELLSQNSKPNFVGKSESLSKIITIRNTPCHYNQDINTYSDLNIYP